MKYKQQILNTTTGYRIAVLSGQGSGHGGPPVVLLHGILGSIRFWPKILPAAVRDHARWHSISLPGHHPAQLPPQLAADEFTSEAIARTYEEVFNRLFGQQSIAVVGYSTGGFVALNHALHFPRRISHILSIAGFAHGRLAGAVGGLQRLARTRRVGRFLFRCCLRAMTSNERLFEWMHQWAARRPRCSQDAAVHQTLNAIFADAARHDADGLALMFARLRGINLLDGLPHITANTILASGDQDTVIPRRHTEAMAAAMPHAKLVTLSDSGHLFFADCLLEFQQLLTNWVQSVRQQSTHQLAA